MMKLPSDCETDIVRKRQKPNPAAIQVRSEEYGLVGDYGLEGTDSCSEQYTLDWSQSKIFLVKFIEQ